MKFAFFGTPKFAAIILEKLIKSGMPPALVICNPDKPAGRKQIITPPPTKIVAERHGIPVAQPEILDSNFQLLVSGLDFAVVAAYAKILPQAIIDIFPKGLLGVHPSLLPKYRGTTPIQSAILSGETETGTTIFMLDEKVDHGEIVASSKYKVLSTDTYESLMEKLAELSGELLVETLPKFVEGKIKPEAQNEAAAMYTKKFKTEDAFVDLSKEDPVMLDRKIRALNPQPGAYTIIDGARIKILDRDTIQYEGKTPRKVKDSISYLKSLL